MSAIYQPCTQAVNACSDNGVYVGFLGGTQVSQVQITSEQWPCRVGFPCLLGGLPATIWVGVDDPNAYVPGQEHWYPEEPKPPYGPPDDHDNGCHADNPGCHKPPEAPEVPEPDTVALALIGFVMLSIGELLGSIFQPHRMFPRLWRRMLGR